MRDPRSGFAKSFRNGYAGLGQRRLFDGLIALLSCCACAGSGDSAPPAAAPTISPSATAAVATARPRAIALSYVAPAGCPDVDHYWRHVRARSTIESIAPADAATADYQDVRVELQPTGSGWLGRLTIAGVLEPDREVRGERCEDVVEALALITVLRLEGGDASSSAVAGVPAETGSASSSSAARAGGPTAVPSADEQGAPVPETPANDARTPSASAERRARAAPSESAPRGAPAPSASAPPTKPASPAPAAPAPTSSAPMPSVPSATGSSASERRRADAERDAGDAETGGSKAPNEAAPDDGRGPEQRGVSAAELERSVDDAATADAREPTTPNESGQGASVVVGLAAQAGYATVPPRALRGLLEGELRFGEKMSSWATTLSLAYTRGASDTEQAQLDITLLLAELALCPPSFVDAASLWIRACAGVRGGKIHVIITPTDPSQRPADTWRPWLAVNPSLQLGVPLSRGWAVRGVLQLAVQLVRDSFYVDDDRVPEQPERITFYIPQAVSFEFGLGLGYTF
jgi:hypothetical protein